MGDWVTRDGRRLPIRELESSHLVSILRIVKKRASAMWRAACQQALTAESSEGELLAQASKTWRDYVHESYAELSAEADRRGIVWDLWDGRAATRREEMDFVDLSRRGQLESRVVGALRDAIVAHGPITRETAPSAAKRVIGIIKDHNNHSAIRRETK